MGIVLIGTGLRLAYLVHCLPVCRADEAVFGLMTKHLIEGKGLPIYLYVAHYAGALICYLAALPFLLFGASVPLLKLTTYLFTLPTVVLVYLLAHSLSDRRLAILSALFMAIPPFLITWTGQYAGGGYPETLFFGTLSLFLTHNLASRKISQSREVRWVALLGFLNGVGTWILFSMIPYTLTAWTWMAHRMGKRFFKNLLPIFLAFYAIGISPMVIYNIQRPLATFKRLGANVMEVGSSEISGKGGGELLGLCLSKSVSKLLGLPGNVLHVVENVWQMMRVDASLGLASTVWDILLALALGFLGFTVVKDRLRAKRWDMLAQVVGWMVLFLAVTGLTKTRYISFLYPTFAILLAGSILRVSSKRWFWAPLAALFLSANLVNHLIALKAPESEDRFGELVAFLEAKGFRYGYTDYAAAYPIVFLTKERIIASPAAGPLNVERVPAYTEKANQAKEVFFIFEKDSEASQRFEEALKARRISFKKEEVVRHAVYYDLSKRVYPGDLPLIRSFPVD